MNEIRASDAAREWWNKLDIHISHMLLIASLSKLLGTYLLESEYTDLLGGNLYNLGYYFGMDFLTRIIQLPDISEFSRMLFLVPNIVVIFQNAIEAASGLSDENFGGLLSSSSRRALYCAMILSASIYLEWNW